MEFEIVSKGRQITLFFLFPCSKFDLYSKADELPDVEKLKPYYEGLIEKYIPGVLNWWQ